MPFVNELFKYVGTNVFLETGTFRGDTISEIANNNSCNPKKLISLELSDVFFHRCVDRFAQNPNVAIHKANSKYDLYDIIKNIDSPITFWLDSHWSGTPDVGCDVETICPVLEELEQIKQHHIKTHTIMIDDIRLMNLRDNKHEGFPVSVDQIIKSIYEINPNYLIKYYDDYTSKNDVLVAYIEEKVCIHKYLTTCKTNPQPPGFADYLRGTIALFNLSQKYGYKLLIDNSHPVFKFMKNNQKFVSTNPSAKIIELLPPLAYDDIFNKLNDLFQTNNSFNVMTNSFYNFSEFAFANWGNISEECRTFLKDVLSPSSEISNKVEDVLKNVYGLNSGDTFKVIHVRTGDQFIHTNDLNEVMYNHYYKKICDIVSSDKSSKYVLVCDSSTTGNKLKDSVEGLFYWNNKKIHLGDLKNNVDSALFDTLVDFFIVSKSSEIITNGSGFIRVPSLLYNIPYTMF